MASGGTTYRPKNKKRYTKHGFLTRMSSKGGKKIINSRRLKGRKKLSVSNEKSILVKRMNIVKSSKGKIKNKKLKAK